MHAALALALAGMPLVGGTFAGFSDTFQTDATFAKWAYDPDSVSLQRADSAAFLTGTGVSMGLRRRFNLAEAGTSAITVSLTWTPNVIASSDEDVIVAVCTQDPSEMDLAKWERDTQPCDSCRTEYLGHDGAAWSLGGGSCVGGQMQDENGCTHFYTEIVGAVSGAGVCSGQDCGEVCTVDGSCNPTEYIPWLMYGTGNDGGCCRDPCGTACDPSDIADASGKASVTQALTVTAADVGFSNNIGCEQPTVATSFAAGTDFYVYVVTDNDNLVFVELSEIVVTAADGTVLYSSTFSDAAAFEDDWASPWMNSEGCVAVPDGMLEVSGEAALVMADAATAGAPGASVPLAIGAAESFSVRVEAMPDALAPTTTDHDFGFYVCKDATHTSWGAHKEDDCLKFLMDEKGGYWEKMVITESHHIGDDGSNKCAVPLFATLQLVYTSDEISFTDDAGCNHYRIANPWTAAGYSGDVFVYLAFSEENHLWATILNFVALPGTSPDLQAGTNARLLDLVPNPTACPDRLTVWIWYVAGCALPIALAGEVGPVDTSGECVFAGEYGNQPVYYSATCGEDGDVANVCLGIGTQEAGSHTAGTACEYCIISSQQEWGNNQCADTIFDLSLMWTGQCGSPTMEPTALPTDTPGAGGDGGPSELGQATFTAVVVLIAVVVLAAVSVTLAMQRRARLPVVGGVPFVGSVRAVVGANGSITGGPPPSPSEMPGPEQLMEMVNTGQVLAPQPPHQQGKAVNF